MATYRPVYGLADPLEDYAGYWLKFYEQGTTTPLAVATDSSGGTTLAKAEISSGGTVPIGFIKTAGDVIFIPYLSEAYDGFLFPTEAEADANDTSNAKQLADNVLLGAVDSISDSIADAMLEDWTDVDIVETRSYLGGWAATLIGPAGGGTYYSDGTTGTASTLYTNRDGFYDSTGKGFQLQDQGFYDIDQFGAVGDNSTENNDIPINFCFQACNDRLVPARAASGNIYLINNPLNLGVTDTPGLGSSINASFYGPEDQHAFTRITTAASFGAGAEYSMIRNWQDSWYAPAESRNGPPADMSAVDDQFSRYVNIRNIRFQVQGTQTQDITCIDLIGMQERSLLQGIVCSGNTTSKGWPLRVNSSAVTTGNEVTSNNFTINNWVTIDNGWIGEAQIRGASDAHIYDWTTATEGYHGTEIFDFAMTDMALLELHCEAFVAGGPVIRTDGRHCSIHQSFITVRDGQSANSELILCSNTGHPTGGFGRTGFSISTLNFIPDPAGVTNSATINIVKDESQGTGSPDLREIAYERDGGNFVTCLYNADRAGYSYATGENNQDINEETVLFSQARLTGSLTFNQGVVSANDATPTVTNKSVIYLGNYTTPTNITDFDGEDDDQLLIVINDDVNDHVIVHSASTIKTIGEIDHRLRVGGVMTFHKVAGQTYWVMVNKGTSDPVQPGLTSTTANLASISSGVNTLGKFTGLMIFNTDTGLPVWAAGATAGSVWVDATGATDHTPV